MKVTLNIMDGSSQVDGKLSVKKMEQVNDLFLVEIPEYVDNIEILEIYPVSFMANGTIVLGQKEAKVVSKMADITPNEFDVLCSFYMNQRGVLSLGTIHNLSESVELSSNIKLNLIDYGKHLTWSKLTNKTPLSLFEYAKNELLGINNYEVKKPDYAARSFT